LKKYIKKIVSFILCISLAMGIFTGVVMMPGNAVVAEAAYEFRTGENAKEVYRFLVCTMGFTPAAACGIMANIEYESGFQTNIYGDSGTSFGLCQWHDTSLNSGRMTALFNFCARNGYDVYSVEGQMRYLQYELISSGRYNETYGVLKGAANDLEGVATAAKRWCIYFEVPADREKKAEQRASLAQNTYWPIYGSITGVNACTVIPKGITETSAVLSGSVYKPLNVTIEENGIYFGSSEAAMTKYRNDKFTGATNVYGLSFDFYTSNGGASTTLGVTLEPKTMYYYQFYCISGGVEYKGQLKSFTTALKTKSISIEHAEYDLEFDYEQWYENVSVKKNTNWSMPAVSLNYTVTPADTTDKAVWTSSDTSVATVSDGKVYVKDEGETVITVTSGDYSASCKVYTGRVLNPQLEFKSKTQSTKQTTFVIGDTVQICPVRYSSVNCYYLQIYKVNGNEEKYVDGEFFSKMSDDKTDWWLEETWEFTPSEVGLYKAHMMFANKAEQVFRDFTFEVLDKSSEPIDSSVSEASTPTNSGLGSLAGVSMSLDGYIVLNYYILPTDNSIGTEMSMQFTVDGQTQEDKDYELAVVGNKVAYKYECRLAATELTQNVTAKLVLGDTVKDIKTLNAYSYCKNVLAGAATDSTFEKASPVVKALMNYGAYSQIYFGKNTSNLANAGLYSAGDADPVLNSDFADIEGSSNLFGAYLNGGDLNASSTDSNIAMNGIQYIGASLTLDSGTGLNIYYILPENMSATDLSGYVISVDGVGNISFVSTEENVVSLVENVDSASSQEGETGDVQSLEPENVEGDGDGESCGEMFDKPVEDELVEKTEAEETNSEGTVIEGTSTEETIADEASVEVVGQTLVLSAVIDNETAISYTLSGSILCVHILNIAADELDNTYSIKLKAPNNNELLIKYSPMQYMIDMQGAGSNSGVNMIRAMYLYYKAVEAYKG